MNSSSDRTVLSLFAGAGGMDIGLEAAGFKQVRMLENNPVAQQTLIKNRPDWKLSGNGDVNMAAKSLTPRSVGFEVGELDLVAGGPPCQPFSLAAQWSSQGRLGMQDPRTDTVHSTISLIEQFAPKVVLLENVVGFIRGTNSALSFLESELSRIGRKWGIRYVIDVRILNAADFGVPQNRRRAIVVAHRSDLSFEWPQETHATRPLSTWDAISGLPSEASVQLGGRWAKLLPSVPPGENYQWFTNKGSGPELFGYRSRFWNFLLKLDPEMPSWTLAASPGPATGPFHWDNRHLTIAERMRIQTFPDDWQFTGTDREVVKQIGNATPPLLAEVVGREIARSLGAVNDAPIRLLPRRASVEIPALPELAPLAIEYDDLVGHKSPHAGVGLGPSPRSK